MAKKLLVVGAAGQIVINAEDRRVYEAKKYVILRELPDDAEVTDLSPKKEAVTTIKPKKAWTYYEYSDPAKTGWAGWFEDKAETIVAYKNSDDGVVAASEVKDGPPAEVEE